MFCLLLASSTQISSVSVALGYYEQYLASPASTTTSSDASGSKGAFREGSISRTHRRRFQEKVEEEEDEDVENDFLGKKTALVGGSHFVFVNNFYTN